MYKIDLHTHSVTSPDGSLNLADYCNILESGRLDYIAITDHDTTDFALSARQALGERIIVGEEITTLDGELIGLFLKETIPPGLTAAETARHIHAQGGLVYVPHPFETVRKGLTLAVLRDLRDLVDIIEVHNGRAIFQNRGKAAQQWAHAHALAMAASSDAHGKYGWGKTYSVIPDVPTRDTLVQFLGHTEAELYTGMVGVRGILYPKFNRLRKRGSR
ncbi:MAG TPA: PHP domain-containing protein [Candidatus Saccharimonadales bacterium]|nr:PHP domain-containing protein [Candidatus Saccharimonadales bacterium]